MEAIGSDAAEASVVASPRAGELLAGLSKGVPDNDRFVGSGDCLGPIS